MNQPAPTTDWLLPLCPDPPTWTVDWPAIQARYDWLAPLAGVPQDPVFHAEGDVLVHTGLVAEALVGLPAWRALSPTTRALLFAAALLHDIGKPGWTRVEPNGRIGAPGHARAGAMLTRWLLWTGRGWAPPPLAVREAIVHLVRWHGLPLWFLDRPDPARGVIQASQTVRLDWLAQLAEADVLGRHCPDRAALLDRVALFRDFSAELGCATAPRRFPSEHSRFTYFRAEEGDPDRLVHDDTRFEVTLLSGLPGAGKNTWVGRHGGDLPVITLDDLRVELAVRPNEPQGAVVRLARERARDLLRRQQPFIWNATNIARQPRRQLIDLFTDYHARVRVIYLDAPYDLLLQRNRQRAASLPDAVLHRLMRRLDVPDLTEARQVIWLG